MYRGPSTEATLLARNAPRSEHEPVLARNAPRSEHDPEHGGAPRALEAERIELADNITMYPFTGAFIDPAHESAFAAQLYRMAFPAHSLLMAVSLAGASHFALTAPPELRVSLGMVVLCMTVMMVGRILLHRMCDVARSQRIGSWVWAGSLALMGLWLGVCWQFTALATVCAAIKKDRFSSLISLATALINGSHGMGFALKLSLIGLFLGDCLVEIAICGDAVFAVALVNMGGFIVGATVAHMVELSARRNYAEKVRGQIQEMEERRLGGRLATRGRQLEQRNEQLQTSNERLLYDMQRRGHPLDNDDERSAICRGLQAEPGQPHLPADGTDSSETEAPHQMAMGSETESDAPPPSLPPGPPSSSSSNATKFNKAGSTSSKSSKAGSTCTSSTCRVPSSQAGHSTVPPPSWAELAYRRHYAELGVKTEQGGASGAQSNTAGKSTAPPLTWPEFYEVLRKTKSNGKGKRKAEAGKAEPVPLSWAEGDRQFYASAAGKAYLAAANRCPFNLMRNASTASSSSAASSSVARLATEPEAALAPPDAQAASSHEQRHAESTGVAWLTPEERCMHSMQPELAAEIAEMGEEEVVKDMAEIAEMGEEEVFAALIALSQCAANTSSTRSCLDPFMGSTSEE